MIKNNPVRCAAEGCAFYSVVFGGFCEECEMEAHQESVEAMEVRWLNENFERMERESMIHYWEATGVWSGAV